MSEVVVVAITTAAAGQEQAVQALAESVISETHAENGCITYALHRDVSDPARFVYVERWASLDALTVHGASAHITQFRAALQPMAGAASQVLVLDALPVGDPAKGTLAG